MGFGIAIAGAFVGLIGLGIGIAGIYYMIADWGSEEGGIKARAYSLVIAGIIILGLAIAGMCYLLFKPSTGAATKATKRK